MIGLGVTAPRPGCPATTFSATSPVKDPCEIKYRFDFPVIGEEDIGIPLNQIINDAKLQISESLPQLINTAFTAARPKINDVMSDVEYMIPEAVDEAMEQHVWPEIDRRKALLMAEVDVVKDDAVKAALAVTATVVMSVGLAAWWVKKGG